MRYQILTANRTADGVPLYWNADGDWVYAVSEAALFETPEASESALGQARLQEAHVCDPYLLKVRQIEGALELPSQREVIRAAGDGPLLDRIGYPSVSRGAQEDSDVSV